MVFITLKQCGCAKDDMFRCLGGLSVLDTPDARIDPFKGDNYPCTQASGMRTVRSFHRQRKYIFELSFQTNIKFLLCRRLLLSILLKRFVCYGSQSTVITKIMSRQFGNVFDLYRLEAWPILKRALPVTAKYFL